MCAIISPMATTSKRGEIASLQRKVQQAIAERRAAVRPLSGLPASGYVGRASGKRTVPTR